MVARMKIALVVVERGNGYADSGGTEVKHALSANDAPYRQEEG